MKIGKMWGKLYSFSNSGRSANNWTETNGIMSIKIFTSCREPDVTRYNTNYDIDSKLTSYLQGQTRYEMISKEMEENFRKMIKSIKEYGGFYIGRYEAGRESSSQTAKAVVRKMNENIGSITWYNSYKSAQELKANNENIETSLISGVLWDETLEWLVKSGATNSTGNVIGYSGMKNSTSWGNYYSASLNYIKKDAVEPKETEEKASSMSVKIPSGSTTYTKANNVYDLAGNVMEWTLEANSTYGRVSRGGNCNGNGYGLPASSRNDYGPAASTTSDGSRPHFYIK